MNCITYIEGLYDLKPLFLHKNKDLLIKKLIILYDFSDSLPLDDMLDMGIIIKKYFNIHNSEIVECSHHSSDLRMLFLNINNFDGELLEIIEIIKTE